MAKVLLIEDDNNLREIFEMRLQAEGYHTVTAGNGEEGLTVAMQEKPDLIISDVMMPKLSGFEMLETLRAAPEGKNIKVIMMTALGQAEDRARGEKLGVVKYLVKSQATLEDFARVVREVLPPDGGKAAEADKSNESSKNNQQEGKTTMPEDPTTPTNPSAAPADAQTPPADPSVPPVSNPMAAPDAGISNDQQSASQEQSSVNSQINDFVSSAPGIGSATTPADNSPSPVTAAPSEPTTVTDPAATPGAPDMSAPTTADAPAVPPVTPPADTPPATPPQTDSPAAPGVPTDGNNSNAI